jgi:hypothetical protein
VLKDLGRYSEAESMHMQTLATSETVLGVTRPGILTSVYNLADLLAKASSTSTSRA